MYSREQTIDLGKKVNEIIKLKYDCDNITKEANLLKKVCELFDSIKDFKLTQTQLRFLYKFANIVGVPQYYKMLLNQKDNKLKLREIHLDDLNNMLYDSSLFVSRDKSFHRYQKEVFEKFNKNERNRYFLTAPTSFGKTFIVNEIIKKMNYQNVVLIFPTLSLLAENYVKLLDDEYFDNYNIHTLSDDEIDKNAKNLFIFTPERFLSMTDKFTEINFDFVFMDEIYKIDNQFIIDDDTIGESERDLSFRVALQLVCKYTNDILLAGPYIEIKNNRYSSIQNFFNDNNFKIISYNDVEIVGKSLLKIEEKKEYNFESINFNITRNKSKDKLEMLLKALYTSENNGSIIYTGTRRKTEQIAKWVIGFKDKSNLELKIDSLELRNKFFIFTEHIKSTFSEDWILYKALLKGVGIHHSYIPKYIQKEIISFFNVGILDTIISTTTITEGVNTSAKNMIVMSDKKGNKTLKKFDAQNIAGRAGRFMQHYKGFVFSIDNNFEQILNSESDELKNLEYDKLSRKSEVDIFMADDKYLTENQKISKKQLLEKAKNLGLNINIVKKFKTIKLSDKIKLYETIIGLSNDERQKITNVLSYDGKLNWDNFDFLLETMFDIIENDDLKRLIANKTKQKHTYLTVKVYSYLLGGFPGVLEFEKQRNSMDRAVKETSKLTFNIFKYHLVKYLGIMDVLLKFNLAKINNCNVDDIKTTLSLLITLLEYNCINENAKKISDYGVPFNVLKYFDTEDIQTFNKFDEYEHQIYVQIKNKFKI